MVQNAMDLVTVYSNKLGKNENFESSRRAIGFDLMFDKISYLVNG